MTQSLNQYQPFLYKRVSLISVNFLRYEGNLVAIQENSNSLILSNVQCFGTEDREVAKTIPAAKEVYEYIIFKDAQIKSLNLSNDQFVYGMNPNMMNMMYNMYPNYSMGGHQPFYNPGFPMYYYNWQYGQMPPMNNFMPNSDEMKWPNQRFPGDFNSFEMNNMIPNQGNMNEQFENLKKDGNFDGKSKTENNPNMFKVDTQNITPNKPNEFNNQTQKLNEVQTKLNDLNLNKNDTQTKTNEVQTSSKQTDNQTKTSETQPKLNDMHKSVQTHDKKPEIKNTEVKIHNHIDPKTQNDVRTQNNVKTGNTLKNETPKSTEVRKFDKTNEDIKYEKSHDKNRNVEDIGYKKNYHSNNRYNNGYNNNRYNGNQSYNNRYNGNNYNNNYKGPRRNYNDRPSFNNEVIDIFESTKKFEKEKELAQIEAEFQKQREEGNLPEDLDPEKAYDPTSSIYDNLSCETTDKKNNKRINKMERHKQLKEQERIDAETFGLSFNNSGYSNNFNANRNFQNKAYRNTNYSKGPNPSHRQHNPRQQYTPKGQQKKVFRVKNTTGEEN